MRSSGGAYAALVESVAARTKSSIACLAGPSFQEASGPAEVCAWAVTEASSAGSAGSVNNAETKSRRLIPVCAPFMSCPFVSRQAVIEANGRPTLTAPRIGRPGSVSLPAIPAGHYRRARQPCISVIDEKRAVLPSCQRQQADLVLRIDLNAARRHRPCASTKPVAREPTAGVEDISITIAHTNGPAG